MSSKKPHLQDVALDLKDVARAVLVDAVKPDARGSDVFLFISDLELERLVDPQLQDARARVETAFLQSAVETVPEALQVAP